MKYANDVCQRLGASLPSKDDVTNCEGEGCYEVLANMMYSSFMWSSDGECNMGDNHMSCANVVCFTRIRVPGE